MREEYVRERKIREKTDKEKREGMWSSQYDVI